MRRSITLMEPLEKLRTKIAGFPGYDGDVERRRSDSYVRSYLGEALTEFAERCPLSPELQTRLDDLVFRLEFADPHDFAVHHGAVRAGVADASAVAAADAATIDIADRAASIDAGSAATYLDEVTAVLDNRAAAMRAASLH